MQSSSCLQWHERAAQSPAAHSGDSLSPLAQVEARAQARGSSRPTTGPLQSPPLFPDLENHDMHIKQLSTIILRDRAYKWMRNLSN